MDNIDRNILRDLEIEFEYEMYGTLNNAQKIIGDGEYNVFSQKAKYLYYYDSPGKASIFINLLGEGEEIFGNNRVSGSNISTGLGSLGGIIRGTFSDKFGFLIKGTNGAVFGDRNAALHRKDIAYNFKFNSLPLQNFFDETQGYMTAYLDPVSFKIGRDRVELGYGAVKALLGNNDPLFDYIGMNIKYKFFNFSYFHGKLLGDSRFQNDPVTGGIEVVQDKFIGYHRIGFDISRDINFGVGEFIIYANRSIDISYLNPFSFYKSVEHANRDRDNSMLFFDFSNNSIKGLKLFGTVLIDDISIGKLNTNYYGNQFVYNAGIYSTNLYKYIPAGIRLEYMRISPYVYTHRISSNNFTNFGYPLASSLQPNSELFFSQINYRLNYRLRLSAGFSYAVHGANPVNVYGTVTNVGGNIALGHRENDSLNSTFLAGDLEYLRTFSASLSYEPFKQIVASLKLEYSDNSLQNSVKYRQIVTFINLSAEL